MSIVFPKFTTEEGVEGDRDFIELFVTRSDDILDFCKLNTYEDLFQYGLTILESIKSDTDLKKYNYNTRIYLELYKFIHTDLKILYTLL